MLIERPRVKMIGKLNHVAIAVKNISSSAKTYKKIFGAQVSEPLDQPIHGVTVVFVTLANTKIELISPLGESSPIMNFFNKNQIEQLTKLNFDCNNVNNKNFNNEIKFLKIIYFFKSYY